MSHEVTEYDTYKSCSRQANVTTQTQTHTHTHTNNTT